MKYKGLLIILTLTLSVFGCKKNNVPVQDDYYFTFNVKISNKIQEPTIINGIHGHVLEYNGNFMPTSDGEVNAPDTVRNELYLYESSMLNDLQEATYEDDGTKFYNLKQLEENGIEPKFIVSPNKHGFYQVDTNDKEYLVLIEVKKGVGYYNGGALQVGGQTVRLLNLNMKIDHNATF